MRWISSRLEHMLRLSFPIVLVAVLSVALTSISALANSGQGSLASQVRGAKATITARPGTSPGTTITVGSMPWGVAILRGPAHLAYVSNNNSGSVSVISTLLRRVVATVPVGPGPNAVVAAPDGRAVYVGLDTNIAVIDTLTQRVTRYIDDPDGAFDLAISPDGRRLYADPGGAPVLSVFDTRTGGLIETVNLGTDSPASLAVSRDGGTLYAGIFSKPFAVDVIDTRSFRVTARVSVALNPMGIALSPRGRELYVTNWGDFSNPNNFIPGQAVQVIETISLQASSPIQVGLLPTAIAFAPDGRHAYVVNSGSNSVSVIRTRDRKVVADLGVGFIPQDVAVTPSGRQAYVTNTGRSGAEGNTVTVLPLSHRE